MKKLAFALLLSTVATSGVAQNNRSFVATFGNDANPCTPGAECRSFVRALAVTNPGGDIIALSSGGYGPFTVSQAVNIAGSPGVIAAITVSTFGNGVTIAAGAGDPVSLRGLSITVLVNDMISSGIVANSYSSILIQDTSVTGGAAGIRLQGDANSFALLTDVLVQAVDIDGIGVYSRAALNRCTVQRSGYGLAVHNSSTTEGLASAVDLVSVKNSVGAYATNSYPASTRSVLNLDRALISFNGVGVSAQSGSTVTVRVSNSTVTENNGGGFVQSMASNFYSMGNNMVEGNGGSDTIGTITPITGR